MTAAMENIDSRDAGQRANALETLESVGEPAIVRPLVRAWEGRPAGASDPGSAIADGLRDGDPWVRACAAFAAGDRAALRLVLEALARDDPDTLVRDTASAALEGDGLVETLPNLSLVERVTYLVRAPLFAKLSPSDIQRVAEIAAERAHADGDVIAEQGEPGDEMFVVVSGEIAVVLGGDGESPVEVARRGAGEAIGEMAVISHAPRMASIVATGDVRLLAIDRRRFERILRDRPDVALAVMDCLPPPPRVVRHHAARGRRLRGGAPYGVGRGTYSGHPAASLSTSRWSFGASAAILGANASISVLSSERRAQLRRVRGREPDEERSRQGFRAQSSERSKFGWPPNKILNRAKASSFDSKSTRVTPGVPRARHGARRRPNPHRRPPARRRGCCRSSPTPAARERALDDEPCRTMAAVR